MFNIKNNHYNFKYFFLLQCKPLQQASEHFLVIKANLRLAVDQRSQIPRVVCVPDVDVMRRHQQLLVPEAEELQLCEPHLQGVPPVGQDLHGDVQRRRDVCWRLSGKARAASLGKLCSVSINHQLPGGLCVPALRNATARFWIQLLQGLQQPLLLPKQKDNTVSWSMCFVLGGSQLSGSAARVELCSIRPGLHQSDPLHSQRDTVLILIGRVVLLQAAALLVTLGRNHNKQNQKTSRISIFEPLTDEWMKGQTGGFRF